MNQPTTWERTSPYPVSDALLIKGDLPWERLQVDQTKTARKTVYYLVIVSICIGIIMVG